MKNLIIIRGNSGAGKTTIATSLRNKMHKLFGKESTMLIQQDVIRREILRVKDIGNNISIGLIEQIFNFGATNKLHIIIEGIFNSKKYGEMFERITNAWQGRILVYYHRYVCLNFFASGTTFVLHLVFPV